MRRSLSLPAWHLSRFYSIIFNYLLTIKKKVTLYTPNTSRTQAMSPRVLQASNVMFRDTVTETNIKQSLVKFYESLKW